MHTVQSLDLNDAFELQAHILSTAESDGGKPVAVCIVDARAAQLTAATMPGVKPPSTLFAHAKAVTAVRYMRNTVLFQFHYDPEADMWLLDEDDGYDAEDLANCRKIDPIFCSWPGGTLVHSPHAPHDFVAAIGVSNRDPFDDHDLSSQRPAGWTI